VTLEEFKEEVDQLIVEIKASPVMSGFQEILLPGEREYRMMEKRKREGIPVHEKIWQEILETCNKLQIDAQSIME
jgi:LDH2 family malate/lactate/ureidoglycolate dehydrogenase